MASPIESMAPTVFNEGPSSQRKLPPRGVTLLIERMIQDAMQKVIKGRTSLVIAHRLSTIRDVDTIIVLHDGKVVETGTHDQLLFQQGTYEKLYHLQFKPKM